MLDRSLELPAARGITITTLCLYKYMLVCLSDWANIIADLSSSSFKWKPDTFNSKLECQSNSHMGVFHIRTLSPDIHILSSSADEYNQLWNAWNKTHILYLEYGILIPPPGESGPIINKKDLEDR